MIFKYFIFFALILLNFNISAQEKKSDDLKIEVLYFDHQSHGIQQEGISALCKDGIDNDIDGKKDSLDIGCKENPFKNISCQKCHTFSKNKDHPYQFKKIGHSNCEPCHIVSEISVVAKTPSNAYCRSCHINGETFRFEPFKQSIRNSRFITSNDLIPEGGWSNITISNHFDHERHAQIGGVCKQCHIEKTETTSQKVKKITEAWRGSQFDTSFPLNGHDGCFKCHENIHPKPNDCVGCHEFNKPLKIEINKNRTLGQFSHSSHKDNLGQLPCKNCHSQVNKDDTSLVVLPKKGDCVSCHSGKIAFDTSEKNCNNCHNQ